MDDKKGLKVHPIKAKAIDPLKKEYDKNAFALKGY